MDSRRRTDETHAGEASGNFDEVAEAVQKMLEDGFFDGLVRRYEGLYPDYAPLVEDVVLDGVEHLAIGARTRHIRDPRALLSSDDYGSRVERTAKLHPLWRA